MTIDSFRIQKLKAEPDLYKFACWYIHEVPCSDSYINQMTTPEFKEFIKGVRHMIAIGDHPFESHLTLEERSKLFWEDQENKN